MGNVPKKLTAARVVHAALNWGAESVSAMIDCYRDLDGKVPTGSHQDAEYVADLVKLHTAMIAYRKKRFGWTYDPLAGAKKIDALTRKPIQE